jgi:integrase
VPTVRLTETAVRRALRQAAETRQRVELTDAACAGLRLRATPAGAATWALVLRDPTGRLRRFTLGGFPAVGIAEARRQAERLRHEVRHEGRDPVAERREKRGGSDAPTLRVLVDTYGGPLPGRKAAVRPTGPGRRLKAWIDARRRIERVFADFLDRPLATLDRRALQMAADNHAAVYSGAAAVRYLRPVLKWAAARSYLDEELARLRPPATSRRRDRVLTREEVRQVYACVRASPRAHDRLVAFAFLTLARRGEIAAARWRDVDLDAREWTIPDTKSGTSHRVPLSWQAVELLREMGRGEPDALVFLGERGGALSNWARELRRIHAATGTSGRHRHDVRRTAATLLGELGVEPHIVEIALGHVDAHSRLASVYNRARYFRQVAEALQRLADHLDGIVAGGAEVVALAR